MTSSLSSAPALFRAFPVPVRPGVLRGQGDRVDRGGAKPTGPGLQQPRAVCARQGWRVSVGAGLLAGLGEWWAAGDPTPGQEGGSSVD